MIQSGEPLHALPQASSGYVEVRLMDLDPFETVGINATTMRFLDVLHCCTALSDSVQDTLNIAEPADRAALAEPGTEGPRRSGKPCRLGSIFIIDECLPIAIIRCCPATGALVMSSTIAPPAEVRNTPDTILLSARGAMGDDRRT